MKKKQTFCNKIEALIKDDELNAFCNKIEALIKQYENKGIAPSEIIGNIEFIRSQYIRKILKGGE